MKAEVKKEEVVEEQIEEDEEEYEEEDVEELKRKVMPAPKQQTKPVKTAVSAAKKTSVFERLGDSNVTSTTPENPESAGSKVGFFKEEKTVNNVNCCVELHRIPFSTVLVSNPPRMQLQLSEKKSQLRLHLRLQLQLQLQPQVQHRRKHC